MVLSPNLLLRTFDFIAHSDPACATCNTDTNAHMTCSTDMDSRMTGSEKYGFL